MTKNRLAAIGSTFVVVCALLASLYILGTPAQERLRRLDEQRVADLQQLSNAITRIFTLSANLPEDLTLLVDGQRLNRLPTDPVTDASYQYEILNTNQYRLCAEFSLASEQPSLNNFWAHPAGGHCFDFSPRAAEN